jgi:hypothetical protein
MSTWNEQWKRVNRYYDRFKQMNEGLEGHGEPSEYHFDDMLAFFQNCFHLRDWLKKDNFASAKFSQNPSDYVKIQQDLALCADLANAVKHMKLDRPTKTGAEPKLANRGMSITGGSPIIMLKANIEHNGVMIDAFKLATKCMAAWSAYLSLES